MVSMIYAVLTISLLLYLSLVINEINCEIFSAIEELEQLAANENALIFELEKFANQVKDDYVYRYEYYEKTATKN